MKVDKPVICKLCLSEFKNYNGLAKHIFHQHDISKKEYYDKHIGIINSICICGKEKKFRNIGEGYRTYCSPQCRSNNIEPSKPWLGIKQTQELIDKRRNRD